MATMNVSLPDPMKECVDAQTDTGRYANPSDYICHLIRQDRERAEKVSAMQRLVDAGLESGIGNRDREELFDKAMRLWAGGS
ncbi:type II toxin-antitoxin system ParD family antitoxin [Rhizobium sp. CAU 1783]